MDDLTQEEKDAINYRFAGYNMPKITLDDGFEYDYVQPHPYFYNQPQYWAPPVMYYKTTEYVANKEAALEQNKALVSNLNDKSNRISVYEGYPLLEFK